MLNSSSPDSVTFRRAILASLPFKNIEASSVVATTTTVVLDPKLPEVSLKLREGFVSNRVKV